MNEQDYREHSVSPRVRPFVLLTGLMSRSGLGIRSTLSTVTVLKLIVVQASSLQRGNGCAPCLMLLVSRSPFYLPTISMLSLSGLLISLHWTLHDVL